MENKVMNFTGLVSNVQNINTVAGSFAKNAVNQLLTIRNWLIGYYIVEYEQRGSDRAKYGESLLEKLAASIATPGLNRVQLGLCRQFYNVYPQICATVSNKFKNLVADNKNIIFDKIYRISESDILALPTGNSYLTPPDLLISRLSFSHIREIMTIDDAFERYFYEIECIKCGWSVRELRRQIATNLFFRAGISKRPELLLNTCSDSEDAVLSVKDPFVLEF